MCTIFLTFFDPSESLTGEVDWLQRACYNADEDDGFGPRHGEESGCCNHLVATAPREYLDPDAILTNIQQVDVGSRPTQRLKCCDTQKIEGKVLQYHISVSR